MNDLISRSELIDYFYFGIDDKPIIDGISDRKIINIIKNQPTAYDIDKIIEELEELKMRYFITIANTGDEKSDFAYENVGNALDKAIKIVKQGVVSDDVCEWEKCSSGSVDFYVYSSKCFTKNLKEIGTTTNFIDDWKYCPYCGKKIKVLE